VPLVTEAELARVLQRDRSAVHVAAQSGRLTRRPDGLFDLDHALAEWAATTQHERGHNNRKPKSNAANAATPTLPADIPAPDIPLLSQPKSTDYARARAGTQIYEALLKKLRYEERAKNLTPTADVADARFKELRIIRDACFNIPSRIAAQLAIETNVQRCEAMLEMELFKVFTAFDEGKLQ
jgi:hypothetical protein